MRQTGFQSRHEFFARAGKACQTGAGSVKDGSVVGFRLKDEAVSILKTAIVLALAITVSGCGPKGPRYVPFPIVGKLSNGDVASGNVIIDLLTKKGTVEITTVRGFNCTGTYRADRGINTITIPVECNDGQTGVVVATRDATMKAGTATARLSNGMTGNFLFGNVSAAMQADFLNDL